MQTECQVIQLEVEYEDGELNDQEKIMNYILNNDLPALNQFLTLSEQNLNFLSPVCFLCSIDSKFSPLTLACYLGQMEIVKLLLENEGISVDFQTEEHGYTALMISCMTGNYEILQLLILDKADFNIKNSLGQTALLLSFQRLQENCNCYENKLICFKMVDLMLQNQLDINQIVDEGENLNLLTKFCLIFDFQTQREVQNNYEVIEFLLKRGALLQNKSQNLQRIRNLHPNSQEIVEILENQRQVYFYKKKNNIDPILFLKKQKKMFFENEEMKIPMKPLCGLLNFLK